MARLMDLIAEKLQEGSPVANRILGWTGDPAPSADSLPLRLAGALHALRIELHALADVYPPNAVDDETLWAAIDTAINKHSIRILHWLDQPPQTNEVRRAAVILPALAVAHQRYDMPVELLELGCSGGLNLRADKFRLDGPQFSLGPKDAGVVLTPDWTGIAPPETVPPIVRRAGVDLAPIDATSTAGRLKLLAYLWPDQPDRQARTTAAIETARDTPASLSAGDAGAWLTDELFAPARGRLRVVFHTVAWQYFPEDTANQALAAMENTSSPLVRIAMEADGGTGALLTLTHYPSGETQQLGRADFHGRWIEWTL